ncbi:MAG TPA: alpha-glucan family phosphorylase [Anaerolineae bacterium]|nr:alpha-glucan family phosphorylase [Anaerolineae bacterium]HQH36904.1 alpha-glucan family phosphorylase [Anaerolineae bacterium]
MDQAAPSSLQQKLPPRLARLEELAYNLWWSWHRASRDLFKQLDRTLWTTTRHNPVRILQEIPPESLNELAKDPIFLRDFDAVLMEMDRDTHSSPQWYSKSPIAYLSAEFGLHASLPIYSGGLGGLSGDHAKEASDMGLPFVAVGFLYEQGYFRQRMDPNGWQEAIYPPLNTQEVAMRPVWDRDGERLLVPVKVGDRHIYLQVWEVLIGRTHLYLMDADVEQNAPWDRQLTARLYGGDRETRIQQEILLGIGGVQILRRLGIQPVVWHINEGHSAFMVLERAREFIAQGMSFEEAKARVRAGTIFTTHTPVAAGHDTFNFSLMDKYFYNCWPQLNLSREEFLKLGSHNMGDGEAFNMTKLALEMAGRANGVSELHGEVSRHMWQSLWPGKSVDEVPIGQVTNGVHLASWTGEAMHRLYHRYVSPDWMAHQDDPLLWARVEEIPAERLWEAHIRLKRKMFSTIRERAREARMQQATPPDQLLCSGIFLDPDALVIGFARRFATYKRANLIFRDMERLKALVHDRYRPVQFIFAGKAHPADDPGKLLLQQIYNIARSPEFGGRIAFVEDYDMHVSRYLTQGVDVWLNTPRKPMEASGTSGMKAAFNGILNLSILDGWWAEAYNGRNGWAINPGQTYADPNLQDDADANALYKLLEEQVVPLFYKRDRDDIPREWVTMMKEAIRTIGAHFSTRRMVQEYLNEYYIPALKDVTALNGNIVP